MGSLASSQLNPQQSPSMAPVESGDSLHGDFNSQAMGRVHSIWPSPFLSSGRDRWENTIEEEQPNTTEMK